MAATNRKGLTDVQQQAIAAGERYAEEAFSEAHEVRVKLYDADPILEVVDTAETKGYRVVTVPSWDLA